MDALELLEKDHKRILNLFREYDGENVFQKREVLAAELFNELEAHGSLKEEIFYPAIQERAEPGERKRLDDALEENRFLKELVEELKNLDVKDEEFEIKFRLMKDNVEKDILEEEGEIFPLAKSVLRSRSDELGHEMEKRKAELLQTWQGLPSYPPK